MNEREERQIFDAKKISDEIDALRNNDQEYDFICNITSYHLRLFAEGLRSLAIAQCSPERSAEARMNSAKLSEKLSRIVLQMQRTGDWRLSEAEADTIVETAKWLLAISSVSSTDSEYDDSVSVADVKGILAPSSTDRGGK